MFLPACGSRFQQQTGACQTFDKNIKSCPRGELVFMGHCVWTTQMIHLCFRDGCSTTNQSRWWPVVQSDYSLPHNLSNKRETLSFICLSLLLMTGACMWPSTNRIIPVFPGRLRKARCYWRTGLWFFHHVSSSQVCCHASSTSDLLPSNRDLTNP